MTKDNVPIGQTFNDENQEFQSRQAHSALRNEQNDVDFSHLNSMPLPVSSGLRAPVNSSDEYLRNLDNAFGPTPSSILADHSMPTVTTEANRNEDALQANMDANFMHDAGRSLDDYKCPICLDTFIHTAKVDCSYGHRFCNYCISSWISIGRQLVTECPVCRGPIFGKTLDLKTDMEIRNLFEGMSEREKTLRLISIEDRFQIEHPRLNAGYLNFTQSGQMGWGAVGMNHSGAIVDQYQQLQQEYYQRAYHHHHFNPQHYHYQLPAEEGVDSANVQHPTMNMSHNASRTVNGLSDQPAQAANGVLGQDSSQDLGITRDGTSTLDSGQNLNCGLLVLMRPSPSETDINDTNNQRQEENAVGPTSGNERERMDRTNVSYQLFRYQPQSMMESNRWNNNLYLTPEENNRNESNFWSPNGGGNEVAGSRQGIPAANGYQQQVPASRSHMAFQQPQCSDTNGNQQDFGVNGANLRTSDQPIHPTQPHAAPYNHYFSHPHNSHHHNHAEQWRYHVHPCHVAPVLVQCSPVMPAPVTFATTCSITHCYMSSCQTHSSATSNHHHAAPGMVHVNGSRNLYSHVEANQARQNGNCATPRMRPNMPGRNSVPIQLPTPNIPSNSPRPRTYSSLPSSPTTGSPRNRTNEEERQRRRQHQRNVSNNFGGLSPRSSNAGGDYGGRSSTHVAHCPVLSRGSNFSGGFSLFSGGYVGFQISHLPAHDRRVVAPPGRITHPLVSLHPLNQDGTSARVTLTFDVHRV